MQKLLAYARRKAPAALKRSAVLLAVGVALLCVLPYITPPLNPAPYLATTPSGLLTDRNGEPLYAYLSAKDQWCLPVSLDDISPYLREATLATEDQRFYQHHGVDAVAVLRAIWQNMTHAGIRSGASTLTMQLVKQHQPSRRSLLSKAHQAWTALRLERSTSKNAILTAYLNSAPYGMNLVGCEAAARRYFGKPARELTLPEAALLAALPKAPSALMPLAHPKRARTRRNYVLSRMHAEGFISESEAAAASRQPLSAVWCDFPSLAPHLAAERRREATHGSAIPTTLDRSLQAMAEDGLDRYLNAFEGEITNGAVIIADAATAEILARVGSRDFFDTPGGGQVDACRALRSPGSALKPFVYGLAIEHNQLYPSERLLDDSLDYGLYNPANFDGTYNGLVSASEALRYSLNVPAVTVLDRLGVPDAYAFLRRIGLSTLSHPPAYYGLGLTLGNCEVRLQDLAGAYCMLANLGVYRPLTTSPRGDRPGKRVLSEDTCAALFTMLRQPLPYEFDPSERPAVSAPTPVCYKTGTSTGYYDAWTFVFDRHYVVGVWLGNNDARPSQRLVGAQAALPLAARLFRKLPPHSGPGWPETGSALRKVDVCVDSGLPATQWCPHVTQAFVPRNAYLNRRCDVHYPAADGNTGIVTRWPGKAQHWDLAVVEAPRSIDQDKTETTVRALHILDPPDQAQFVLTGEPDGDRIRLASSLDATESVYWYLDGRYLGTSTPKAPLFLPLRAGAFTLAGMTPSGITDAIHFAVTAPGSDQVATTFVSP